MMHKHIAESHQRSNMAHRQCGRKRLENLNTDVIASHDLVCESCDKTSYTRLNPPPPPPPPPGAHSVTITVTMLSRVVLPTSTDYERKYYLSYGIKTLFCICTSLAYLAWFSLLVWLCSFLFTLILYSYIILRWGQSCDYPISIEVTVTNMGKHELNKNWWCDHNKTKHDKTAFMLNGTLYDTICNAFVALRWLKSMITVQFTRSFSKPHRCG